MMSQLEERRRHNTRSGYDGVHLLRRKKKTTISGFPLDTLLDTFRIGLRKDGG